MNTLEARGAASPFLSSQTCHADIADFADDVVNLKRDDAEEYRERAPLTRSIAVLVNLSGDKVQYSSLNDPDGELKIERRQRFGAAETPGIVAEFPLHAARIVPVAAGDAFFVEDFEQHLVMEGFQALRGE